MSEFPSFADFYAAVHGRDPFPWQDRLARQVASHGWPTEIGVPTGLGKTSAIDIAVWGLASQADRPARQRNLPTRIWYVVNRRLLVDAASDHVDRLTALLADPPLGPVTEVARMLRQIEGGITGVPLRSLRLRGGAVMSSRPSHPGQPAVVCSTVPMFASRLLFRSYGSSNRMWPVDAALAGIDTLVLLDEAHLSIPLVRLVSKLEECDASSAGVLRAPGMFTAGDGPSTLVAGGRSRPTLVSLTATGSESGERFDLDDEDLRHPVVAQRLSAAKATSVVDTTAARLATTIAEETNQAVANSATPIAVLVFVNRPSTAREVASRLDRRSAEVMVLTGQLREPDADAVRQRLLVPGVGLPAGPLAERERSLIVVATQTLEVGADLDADVVVSQTAGVRALVQRLGRLNRLGQRPHATCVLVHPVDAEPGLYGDEPEQVRRRLNDFDMPVDLGPAVIRRILGAPNDREPVVPELLPVHLWEFAKTSVPVPDAAPAEAFIEGITDDDHTVSVCWRRTMPVNGEPLYPSIGDGEWVEVPIREVRQFLAHNEADAWGRITADGANLEHVATADVRPGNRIVVNASIGGYSTSGWDPESAVSVVDLSPLLAKAVQLSRSTLEEVLDRHLEEEEFRWLTELDDPTVTNDVEAAISSRFATLLAVEAPELVCIPERATIDRIGAVAVPWLRWQTIESTRRVDALDELSIAASADLVGHLNEVGAVAESIARAVGLSDRETRAVHDAARFHDLGKADVRFQRWLGAPAGQVLAKSRMHAGRWRQARIAAGWPERARHELLSLQLLDRALEMGVEIDQIDLVRHLVGSHHGHGRPWIDISGAAAAMPTRVSINGVDVVAHTDTSQADWDQPERFRCLSERYGLWGLALMEAIVRQADHLVSAATEIQ